MKCVVQPVSARVTGERTAGSVAPVRAGRQANDQQARLLIAEPRDRMAPILLICEFPLPGLPDPMAVVAQPGAELAGSDSTVEFVEIGEQTDVLVRKPEQQPVSAPGSLGLDLGKDGKVLSGARRAG
jgi:hypothetical protein